MADRLRCKVAHIVKKLRTTTRELVETKWWPWPVKPINRVCAVCDRAGEITPIDDSDWDDYDARIEPDANEYRNMLSDPHW